MRTSRHYSNDRKARENAIKEIGLGITLHTVVIYDERRNRKFYYDITSTAVLVVRAYDDPSLIITKYPARPSRINRYWKNAPQEVIELSIEHTRMGLVF